MNAIATPEHELVQATPAPAKVQKQEATAPRPGAPASIREFLSFKLGAEEYGIDILRVQEIRSYESPTRIANAPPFVKGVVNLRGVIVPLVDLRLAFGLSEVRYDGSTVVIVLNVDRRVVGVVVDSVSDVVQLGAEQIKPAPEFGASIGPTFMTGIGSLQERMLMLLDIEAMMRSERMGLLSEDEETAEP